jgi:alpha-mannosidase
MTTRTLTSFVLFVLAGAGWAAQSDAPAEVFVVPNFHPASCGWLTDWSTERNYCANSYLDHLDRVRDDPNYAFALSECNTMIAILNFHPDRVAELKQRIREGRVELVNAFFLEPTINLSGGEALVKMGVEGLRWQQAIFGARPRFVWAIDVTGVHEQMAQITSGLGLDAMVYTRDNPTGKSIHWLQAPDGSRCPAISPGHYADWDPVFRSPTPLDSRTLAELLDDVKARAAGTPQGAPVLVLGGAGDYSLAPACADYPSMFLKQWKQVAPQTAMHFTGLGRYVDAILPAIQSGRIELPVSRSGARMSWTSFWIECPKVKQWYRRAEQGLQAAEMLATIASRDGKFEYPVQPLYHAWLQMLLNMDRNTLWGAAGGMVFEHEKSWDARDRFESVEKVSAGATHAALEHMVGQGPCVALFNPLNWPRTDPVRIRLPAGMSPAGVTCQAGGEGQILCQVPLPSTGIVTLATSSRVASAPRTIDLPAVVETAYYRARIDPNSGALCSLTLKSSGREVLAGPVSLVAEQAGDFHSTPRRDQRKRLADSSQAKSHIHVTEGPLAILVSTDSLLLGSVVRQTIHFYRDSPRIDFDVELNDIPDKTIVLAEFPLAQAVQETRRGIPYGFSHAAWERKDRPLAGFGDGIVPAIRCFSWTRRRSIWVTRMPGSAAGADRASPSPSSPTMATGTRRASRRWLGNSTTLRLWLPIPPRRRPNRSCGPPTT